MTDVARPIESSGELVEYFRAAETPHSEWRVGTEHEKIGIYSDSYERVPFEGERGIETLLDRIAQDDGWERIFGGKNDNHKPKSEAVSGKKDRLHTA